MSWRYWLTCVLLGLTAPLCFAQAPATWQWTTEFPFRHLYAVASSEQADTWPAAKAIDGSTDEPEGIWQTARDNPKSAWLELRLDEASRLKAVDICHQQNPRYYRSVDYRILCWGDGEWVQVADVTGNDKPGWRRHEFAPIQTTNVRIIITKSEYEYRMGLNEVRLVLDRPDDEAFTRISEPHCHGWVDDMGIISYEADLPEGTSVELATRTAPEAGGKPGEWSAWSAPYARSGATVTSPAGQWVQFKAIFHPTAQATPELRSVTIGSPDCIERIDFGAVVSQPDKPLKLTARFREPMDRTSQLYALLSNKDEQLIQLSEGKWSADGKAWQFAPTTTGLREGAASLHLNGARRADGLRMMDERRSLTIGTKPILERLGRMAEWIMENEQSAIFVEGYHERTLLALYEITGEQKYLDHVRKWASKLLDLQKPAGYWGTGYGDVYFADTGSALGLLINLYKFATPEERERIDTALERYFDLLLVRGDSTGKSFVHEEGSLGVGYHADLQGNITSDLNLPYTISTALTGAEIFAAWYYIKGDESDKRIAIKACDWLLNTMVGDEPPDPWAAPGQIPYYIDDWNKGRQNREWIWKRWPYDTSAYAGEGFIAAWTYIDDPAFRADLGRRIKPHIEWLLRTQNGDGSWAQNGSGDQLRSHGVVNLLLWYHDKVDADPRVAGAIRRYCELLLDETKSRYLGVPGNGIATSLAGRALVEIVRPGVDCYRWMD